LDIYYFRGCYVLQFFYDYSQSAALNVRDPMDTHIFDHSFENVCNVEFFKKLRATVDVDDGFFWTAGWLLIASVLGL